MVQARPLVTLTEVVARTGLSFPGAADAMGGLVGLGIASEVTGKKRSRVFA